MKKIIHVIFPLCILLSQGQFFSVYAEEENVSDEEPVIVEEDNNDLYETYGDNAQAVSSVTGVTLGDGVIVTTVRRVNQIDIKEKALNEIIYWRKDALSDTEIKLESYGQWYTVREYLARKGISEEEYLDVRWSYALEMIAIQRAVEVGNMDDWYKRPNNGGRATYKGIAYSSSFFWRGTEDSGVNNVMRYLLKFVSEKYAYKQLIQTGIAPYGYTDYTMVINPDYKSYGFGCVTTNYSDNRDTGYSTYYGVSSSEVMDEGNTNLIGNYTFEVALSDEKVNEGQTWIGASKLGVSKIENYKVKMTYSGFWNDYYVKGTYTSSNPSVASVDSNGNVTGISKGATTISVTSGGKTFSKNVDVVDGDVMYRLYNPNSGEHFYTSSNAEKNNLVSLGWNYEGVGWTAPKSGNPVYRLYNANGGEHHYTLSEKERDGLVRAGWKYEGIGWYSDLSKEVPLYREYNPNAFANNHNYTTSKTEHNWLLGLGWKDEGIAWYGIK